MNTDIMLKFIYLFFWYAGFPFRLALAIIVGMLLSPLLLFMPNTAVMYLFLWHFLVMCKGNSDEG